MGLAVRVTAPFTHRCARAQPRGAVKMNRQFQRLAYLPKRIPIRIGDVWQTFGHLAEKIDAAVTYRSGALYLTLDNLGRAQIRHDRQRHVTVAGAAPFSEGVVIGADYVQLEDSIAEFIERSARRIGKKRLGI